MPQGDTAQQQGQAQEVEPQPAPLYAPEQPEPEFITDEGHVPLHTVLWNEAKENATTGMSLLGNLKARTTNVENDIKGKFIGFLTSHRLTRTLGTAAAAFLTPPDNFLTNDQYEKSQYQRPGKKFPNGVYETVAALEAKHFDDQQISKDLNARTDQGTWPTIAKGGSAFAGGIANPLFMLFGGAVGEAVAPAAKFLADFIPELKALSPEANAAVKGFARSAGIGGAVMPVFTGIDYAEERANQEDASIRNILYSVPIGMGFGFIGEGFSRVLSSRSPRLTSEFAEKEGLNKKVEGEPEPIVQEPPISPNSHEKMLTTAVSQLENGKIPEVSEIGKQNYHDSWQENLGNKLREDPEGYAKELEDLHNSRDINQNKLDMVNEELDRKQKALESLTEEKVKQLKISEEPTVKKIIAEREDIGIKAETEIESRLDVAKKFFKLKILRLLADKDQLLRKKLDMDDMIASRENVPEASDMEDLHSKIEKSNSPQSDFSYYEPKEPVEIPEEEKSVNDLLEQERTKFNARKNEMAPEVKEHADMEDIQQKNKGTRKFFNAIEACLRRGT